MKGKKEAWGVSSGDNFDMKGMDVEGEATRKVIRVQLLI